jgi:PadR family transcriptional regulator PadR
MREQTYFILASLLDEPRHGYAITKRVEELSGGAVRLAAGTLYAAIDRLAREGLIRKVSEEIVNGRTRRQYGLTRDGEAAVRAEAARMVAAAAVVTAHRPTRITGTALGPGAVAPA